MTLVFTLKLILYIIAGAATSVVGLYFANGPFPRRETTQALRQKLKREGVPMFLAALVFISIGHVFEPTIGYVSLLPLTAGAAILTHLAYQVFRIYRSTKS
jgi:hypothetical protein